MIEIETHDAGAVLPVRAQPGARANAIRGEQEGRLKVAVTQVAEKGKANRAIIVFLSKSLSVRRSRIELLSGEADARKRFLIRDATPEELREKLRPYVET